MDLCEDLSDRWRGCLFCYNATFVKHISHGGHESLCLASEFECYHQNLMDVCDELMLSHRFRECLTCKGAHSAYRSCRLKFVLLFGYCSRTTESPIDHDISR